MKRFLISVVLIFSSSLQAFEIVIDRGLDKLTPIAVVPFQIFENGVDLTPIVTADLGSSGEFRPIGEESFLSLPTKADDVVFHDWRVLGVEYVIVGSVFVDGLGALVNEFEVIDINRETTLLTAQVKGKIDNPRSVAHHVADEIFRALTNVRGSFSTRVAYVLVENRTYPNERHSLIVADFDGERQQSLLVSDQPILSPNWSADGKRIAYVTFEAGSSAIHMLDLESGQRQILADFEGINSSPAISPDGQLIAMVLSRDGNPDIYTLDVETNVLRRITNHRAIDTEPVWELNGEGLIFTSDRGGSPQLYRIQLDSLRIRRLTYEGSYNARPRIMPDGTNMIFVHRSSQGFHIAWRDIAGNRAARILSSNVLDESPSVAPNGIMMMYATKSHQKGILSIVSVSGEVEFKLTSFLGDLIEPAWSPYLTLNTTFVTR